MRTSLMSPPQTFFGMSRNAGGTLRDIQKTAAKETTRAWEKTDFNRCEQLDELHLIIGG